MKHKPRLLFTSGGYRVFGKERVILTLIRGLLARGYDIHCLVNAWGNDDYRKELREMGVTYTSVYLGWIYPRRLSWTLDSLRNAPQAYAQSLHVYRRFKPDLVVHDSVRQLALLGWRSIGRNLMVVQDYASRPHDRFLVKVLDPLVDRYVPCSQDVGRNLRSAGVPASKIHHVANPANFDEAIRFPRLPQYGEMSVGIVGQVTERKGHHIVLEAMSRIRQRHPELRYQLKIFGDGPSEFVNRLREQAQSLGLNEQIVWCGYRKSKDEIYPEVDFTLVPTINPDPAPLVSIEPAVYGKPVIASQVGGLPEIVRDGITGYLVPPLNPDALADRMIRLLNDPAHTHQLGTAAFADYRLRFGTERFVNEYAQVIEQMIQSWHSKARHR